MFPLAPPLWNLLSCGHQLPSFFLSKVQRSGSRLSALRSHSPWLGHSQSPDKVRLRLLLTFIRTGGESWQEHQTQYVAEDFENTLYLRWGRKGTQTHGIYTRIYLKIKRTLKSWLVRMCYTAYFRKYIFFSFLIPHSAEVSLAKQTLGCRGIFFLYFHTF